MKLEGKSVVVTGGSGFLGRHLVRELSDAGAVVWAPSHEEYDLTRQVPALDLLYGYRADLLVHCAAKTGGIGAAVSQPATFFYDNLVMGVNVLEAARRAKVKRVVLVGSACSYPALAPVPLSEASLWDGRPEASHAPYGLAKRALSTMAEVYRQQYGLDVVVPLLANLYGPGDDFDPATAHVIPATVRRMCEAVRDGSSEVTMWGDGSPTREFLYVEDAARGLRVVCECYDGDSPINLGTGVDISIENLSRLVAAATRFYGTIKWDASKPGGQRRRCLDVTRARALGWDSRVSLAVGIDRTVAWWLSWLSRGGS